MTDLVGVLVGQLAVAAIYALVGVGFVLIYRTTKTLNLAQGVLALLGAYVAYSVENHLHTGLVLSAVIGIAASFAISCAVYLVLMRPLMGQGPVVVIILTLALIILGEAVVPMIWGSGPNYLQSAAWFHKSFRLSSYGTLSHLDLILIVLVVVLIGGFAAIMRWTPFGLATRAAAEDPVLAASRGVNVNVVGSLAWGLAGALAAIAAVEYGSTQGLTASTADVLGFGAFPAIILGGIDSVIGALIGALVLAWAQGLAVLYVSSAVSDVIGYLLLLAVLLVRPRGLFGGREVTRL